MPQLPPAAAAAFVGCLLVLILATAIIFRVRSRRRGVRLAQMVRTTAPVPRPATSRVAQPPAPAVSPLRGRVYRSAEEFGRFVVFAERPRKEPAPGRPARRLAAQLAYAAAPSVVAAPPAVAAPMVAAPFVVVEPAPSPPLPPVVPARPRVVPPSIALAPTSHAGLAEVVLDLDASGGRETRAGPSGGRPKPAAFGSAAPRLVEPLLAPEEPMAESPWLMEPRAAEPVVEEPSAAAAEQAEAEPSAAEAARVEVSAVEHAATEGLAADEHLVEHLVVVSAEVVDPMSVAPPVAEPAAEEPAAAEPAAEEPATEEPAAEEPAAEEPAAGEPAAVEPAVAEPATVEPAAEEPATEEPVAEEPAAEEPAAEEPADQPTAEEPIAVDAAVVEPVAVAPAPVAGESPVGKPEAVDEEPEPEFARPAQPLREPQITVLPPRLPVSALPAMMSREVTLGDAARALRGALPGVLTMTDGRQLRRAVAVGAATSVVAAAFAIRARRR